MVEHDLVSIWSVLSESPVTEDRSLAVAPAAALADGREVLAGLDVSGNRHVLVPLLPSEQFSDAGRGRALQLRLVHLPEGRYASAVCTDQRLEDVFSQFCRELVDSVITSGKPGRDMRVAFGRWRALFSDGPGQRLSKPEEIGLLGELLTLRAILAVGGAVASWEGPTKALHDFRRGKHHLEVKSTLGREGLRVSVHGVDQLAVVPGEELHLLVYRFVESEAGSSLLDVIRDIELVVDDLVHFEVQLRRAGFDWQVASSYEAPYAVVENPCFDVLTKAFPRVVSESFIGGVMPAGTMQLSYVIDLSGPFPAPISDEDHDRVVEKLAGQNDY